MFRNWLYRLFPPKAKASRRRQRIAVRPQRSWLLAIEALEDRTLMSGVPIVSSVSPNFGRYNSYTPVTISGTNFTGATEVDFGGARGTIASVTDSQIVADAPPHAYAAANVTVDVQVRNSYGLSTANPANDAFTYVSAAPTVTSFSPDEGPTIGGTRVTINGANLIGTTQVEFGGNSTSSVQVISDSQIVATSPPNTIPGPVSLRVTNLVGPSFWTAAQFTYLTYPTVTGISPSSGPTTGGELVTISGSSFSDTATTVTFDGQPARVLSMSYNQVTAVAPIHVAQGLVSVIVTTPYGSAGTQFQYDNSVPSYPLVTSISPNSGPAAGGTVVTISGANFTPTAQVWFGGRRATSVTYVSPNQLSAIAPAGTDGTAVHVQVMTSYASSLTAADLFTYGTRIFPPTIQGGGGSGPTGGGGLVTITGSNFMRVTAVLINGTGTDYFVNSPTQITAIAPALSGYCQPVCMVTESVTVTNPAGVGAGHVTFVYNNGPAAPPVPWIGSMSPSSGSTSGRAMVTINGLNLAVVSSVLFGDTPATSFTINSSHQISAMVPPHLAGVVDVHLANSSGPSATTTVDQFTYNALTPTVTQTSPNSGPTAGGSLVTITGTELFGATAVWFGSTPATSFTVNSPTQITATAPLGQAPGAVDVIVTTAGGTSTSTAADRFTYNLVAPTLTGISPSVGATTGVTVVTLTGTSFSNVSAVTFDGMAASFTVNSATQLTVTAPSHPAGAVQVLVTNAAGTSTTSEAFTYSVNATFVTQVYLDLLHRSPDAAGLQTFTTQLDQGATTRTGVAWGILGSTEYASDLVTHWYQTYLLRTPAAAELNLFVPNLQSRATTDEQVQTGILSSPEYYATRANGSDQGFLDALYQDVLGRHAGPGDVAIWGASSSSIWSDTDRANVVATVLQSAEYRGDLIQSYYQTFLGRSASSTELGLWAGASDESIIATILASDEFFSRLP